MGGECGGLGVSVLWGWGGWLGRGFLLFNILKDELDLLRFGFILLFSVFEFISYLLFGYSIEKLL